MILKDVNCEDGIWIKHKIGDWLSHCLVRGKSVKELNELDRIELAEHWYEYDIERNHFTMERAWNVIDNYYGNNRIDFVEDVAVYIDMQLPKVYLKYKDKIDKAPSLITVKLDKNGELPYRLKYVYEENYISILPSSIAPATEKQIKYIETLAIKNNYHFTKKDITKEQASSFINFLKDIDLLSEPEDFQRHFKKAI